MMRLAGRKRKKEEVLELRKKLIKLAELDSKIEFFSVRRGRVVTDVKDIARFSFEEMEKEAEKIKSKWRRKVVQDFIDYLKSQKYIFKVRPKYVNITFEADKSNINNLVDYLRRSGKSFRSFIIGELSEAFEVGYQGKFSMKHKGKTNNLKLNQVLLPQELFESIKAKIESEHGKKLTKKETRKIISKTISEIVKKASERVGERKAGDKNKVEKKQQK